MRTRQCISQGGNSGSVLHSIQQEDENLRFSSDLKDRMAVLAQQRKLLGERNLFSAAIAFSVKSNAIFAGGCGGGRCFVESILRSADSSTSLLCADH